MCPIIMSAFAERWNPANKLEGSDVEPYLSGGDDPRSLRCISLFFDGGRKQTLNISRERKMSSGFDRNYDGVWFAIINSSSCGGQHHRLMRAHCVSCSTSKKKQKQKLLRKKLGRKKVKKGKRETSDRPDWGRDWRKCAKNKKIFISFVL